MFTVKFKQIFYVVPFKEFIDPETHCLFLTDLYIKPNDYLCQTIRWIDRDQDILNLIMKWSNLTISASTYYMEIVIETEFIQSSISIENELV